MRHILWGSPPLDKPHHRMRKEVHRSANFCMVIVRVKWTSKMVSDRLTISKNHLEQSTTICKWGIISKSIITHEPDMIATWDLHHSDGDEIRDMNNYTTDRNMQMSLMPICWYEAKWGRRQYEKVIIFLLQQMENHYTPPRLYIICKWRSSLQRRDWTC